MKSKITKKQAVGGVLGLGLAAVLLTTLAGGEDQKTVTYGTAGEGTAGEGIDYTQDMTGLNDMYEAWLASITPDPQQEEIPLLDTPPSYPMPTPTAPETPTTPTATEGSGLIDTVLNALSAAPFNAMDAAKVLASPLPLPVAVGFEAVNWAGGEFIDRFRAATAKSEADRLGGIGKGQSFNPFNNTNATQNATNATQNPTTTKPRASGGGGSGFGHATIINPPKKEDNKPGSGLGLGGIGGGFGGGFGGAR